LWKDETMSSNSTVAMLATTPRRRRLNSDDLLTARQLSTTDRVRLGDPVIAALRAIPVIGDDVNAWDRERIARRAMCIYWAALEPFTIEQVAAAYVMLRHTAGWVVRDAIETALV
jgi:hypothetical protein